jgi:ATP-dependent DNA ligase
MVAKRKDSAYQIDRRQSTWVKVKNPTYSQKEGRAVVVSIATDLHR